MRPAARADARVTSRPQHPPLLPMCDVQPREQHRTGVTFVQALQLLYRSKNHLIVKVRAYDWCSYETLLRGKEKRPVKR